MSENVIFPPKKMKHWKKNVITLTFSYQFWTKKNCIRILSTRSVVLDRSQSVLIGKMTKNLFKKIKYSFQDTFSWKLFQYFRSTHGRGARPSAPRRGMPSKKSKKSSKFWVQNQGLKKKWSRIYTFGRSASAILTIYNQIFFSRGPSALIFRDLSFLIWFNGICWRKSAFLHEKLPKSDQKKWPKRQKTPKSSRNGHPWVEMGRRPYQNDQKNKIYKNPIELLRQNP